MKKRMIAIALTLTMVTAVGIPVSASTIDQDSEPQSADTQLSFQVNPTYSVTIPEKVVLSGNAYYPYYSQQDNITAENVKLKEGETLNVTLNSDYKLEVEGSDNYTLAYIVQASDINKTTEGYPNDVTAQNNLVAAFGSSAEKQRVRLNFQTNGGPQYAGNYSDTVTFNIAVAQSSSGSGE